MRLYEEPHFTFRFAEDRLISRFHLEGIEAGRKVSVFRTDPGTGERCGLLAKATVGKGGWVGLKEPIIVRSGDAFVAVPDSNLLPDGPGQRFLYALGVVGVLAGVGLACGLARGGNPWVLAVDCAAAGGFVVLLGYGPIALLIGALGACADWCRGKKGRTDGREE
jgi:hypothetical protein